MFDRVRPATDPQTWLASDRNRRVEMHVSFVILGSKPEIYDVVKVKYDPTSHETIFDLTGDRRYDLDAMRASGALTQQEFETMKRS